MSGGTIFPSEYCPGGHVKGGTSHTVTTCFTNVLSSCPPITAGDLGSTTDFSTDGLLPMAVRPPGEAVDPIPVRIINYHVVCDTSGTDRNTSSFVSVLVQFQCNYPSGTGNLAVCDGNINVTRQYQFSCSGNAWDDSIAGDDLFVQTLNPSATFATPLDNQCRRCIDDQQRPTAPIDDDTHCEREFKSVIIYQTIIILGHFHVIMSIQSQHVEYSVPRDRCVALLGQVVSSAATFTCKVRV